MPDWEETFRNWKNPSSDTEAAKCENAEKKVRAAIWNCPVLSRRNIEIFAQGSYRNNTNVRLESDVDICVRCMDVCWTDFEQAPGNTNTSAGYTNSEYHYSQFKNEVGDALVRMFGKSGVTRGNKAFDIHETANHVDADVVPTFEHRRYYLDRGRLAYFSGTEFRPDNGGSIVNWAHQHFDRGVEKNNDTNYRFKYITRVIKRLRYKMDADGKTAAKGIPSYLIECLTYNVPNDHFGHNTYTAAVKAVLAQAFNHTMDDDKCKEWLEVSRLKYLFRSSQPWTRQQAHAFISAAWDYLGFE